MKRLNLITYFDLGGALRVLEPLLERESKKGDLLLPLIRADEQLAAFIKSETGLLTCIENAKLLLSELRKLLTLHFYEPSPSGMAFKEDLGLEKTVNQWETHEAKKQLEAFCHVFAAECRQGESYYVEQIAIYHTPSLVREAAQRFNADIRSYIPPDALIEFNEAGKCLAFGLHTATGFHALRAMEIVMLDYYSVVSGKVKAFKSWGECIKALNELKAKSEKNSFPSPKAIAMLDRIRELDRNPLMHPQDTLNEITAESLFSITAVTITELARDIKNFHKQRRNGDDGLQPGAALKS